MKKYIWYAFGEILLVMVGILLALQVNNWNQARIAKTNEILVLNNLKNDFQLRLDELQEFKEERKVGFNGIRTLNRIIHDRSLMPSEAGMDSLIADINNGYMFNDQFKSLDMLFFTGKINDLENGELKQRLIQWPQQVEEMMEEQRIRLFEYNDRFLDLQYKYIAMRNVHELFEFRGYNIPRGEPTTKKSNYQGLLNDPDFETYLVNTESLLFINEIDSDILIENATNIIELIEQEVDM